MTDPEHQLLARSTEVDTRSLLRRMTESGIGYGAYAGVTWNPALDAVVLPRKLLGKLRRMGAAIFLLYDALAELYDRDPALTELLAWKKPSRVPAIVDGRIDLVRPDLVVTEEPGGELGVRITELESAPGSHGFVAAMDAGYGSRPGLAEVFAKALRRQGSGRYVVCLTHHWVSYLWEQAVFCRELKRHGVDAVVVLDRPLSEVEAYARSLWRQAHDPDLCWRPDLRARLADTGLERFVRGEPDFGDALAGDATVFRMGYFDNLSPRALASMRGRQIANGVQFFLENKALMAAIRLAAVRRWIAARDRPALALLDQGFAATYPVSESTLFHAAGDRQRWVVKYAAWDFGEQSWGSRSLVCGREVGARVWQETVRRYARGDHPAVLQEMIPSVRFRMPFLARDGEIRMMEKARGRLTPFLLRTGGSEAIVGGTYMTLREKTRRVHSTTDSVMGRVAFR